MKTKQDTIRIRKSREQKKSRMYISSTLFFFPYNIVGYGKH